KAVRIILKPGQRRESYLPDCTIQRISWNPDQLIRAAVDSDSFRSPEAAQKHLFEIRSDVHDKPIHSQGATKRMREPTPALLFGIRGTQPVMNHNAVVAVSGRVTVITTNAQYP